MRNILVEGIQGSGKSTLLNKINKAYSELKVIKEGDYSLVDEFIAIELKPKKGLCF